MTFKLTPKEKEIAELLFCGLAYADIADMIGWSEGSVKNQIKILLDRTGMDDRTGLAIWFHEHRKELGLACPCDSGMESRQGILTDLATV